MADRIDIFTDYQIIDDFVQRHDNLEKDRNAISVTEALNTYPGSTIIQYGPSRQWPNKEHRFLRILRESVEPSLSLFSNALLWIDADQDTNWADNTRAYYQPNVSGRFTNNVFTGSTLDDLFVPLYKINQFGSKPSYVYDQSVVMVVGTLPAMIPGGMLVQNPFTQPFTTGTIAFVAEVSDMSTQTLVVGDSNYSLSTGGMGYYHEPSTTFVTPTATFAFKTTDGSLAFTPAFDEFVSLPATTKFYFEISYDGTSASVYFETSGGITSGTIINPKYSEPNWTPTIFILGATPVDPVLVPELFVFDHGLTAAEQTVLRAYIHSKYPSVDRKSVV